MAHQEYAHTLNDFVLPPPNSNGSYFTQDNLNQTINLDGTTGSGAARIEVIKLFFPVDFENPQQNPIDFDFSFVDNGFSLNYTPIDLQIIDPPENSGMIMVDFPQAENQPFSLDFGQPTRTIQPNDDYRSPAFNNLLFPFDASGLNFNSINFEFTSIALNKFNRINSSGNSDTITFEFDLGAFDFSSITNRPDLSFEFASQVADSFDIVYDNVVEVSDNFSFEATAVTFRSDSITFDYIPASLSFDPSAFAANANLYEYKLDSSDFVRGVNIGQLNASDFRALDYAFNGDEIFDRIHYIAQGITPDGMNPFTDYVENGWKLGLDPHPLFDVDYYLGKNTDVRNDGAEPLKHYITKGFSENNPNRDPHPLFDTSYYNDSNTDVVAVNKNPLLHYVESGFTENFDTRDPNRFFDSSYYNLNNPDVVDEGVNPLVHYIQFGWRESLPNNPGGTNPNRDPNPLFDTEFYAVEILGAENVFVFPDVLLEDLPRLRDLEIIRDNINF